MKIKDDFTIKILLVLFLAFLVRIAYVDSLPAALFGDIIEHLRMAKSASVVRWGGDGALFPLLTSITTRIGGLSFLTLKITSVFISLLGVLATILYAKELTKKPIVGLYAGLCMALGFWDISMSHSGKPYSLIPFFAATIPLLLLQKRHIAAGVAVGLSLYSQAAAWGLFIFSLFNPITFLSAIVAGSLFFREMIFAPQNFFSAGSHIGEKLAVSKIGQMGIFDTFLLILKNYFLQIQALFIHGDNGFRGSIPLKAHIDEVTAIFMIVGIVAMFYKIKRETLKKYLLFFVLPFLVIQLPAALDIHNPLSVPSFGRTVGMVPFISLAAGYGIFAFSSFIKKRLPIVLVFIVIGFINLHRFWFVYPITLPNHNVPFAEIIAEKASTISETIPVYTYECCWGQWGQPEPGGFEFLARGETMYPPLTAQDVCMRLDTKGKKAVIFSSPAQTELPALLAQCGWQIEKEEIISQKNEIVAKMYSVTSEFVIAPTTEPRLQGR